MDGAGEDDGADVEDALAAAGGASDLEGGEGRNCGGGAGADEEADGADEGVAKEAEGVDLDGDGGGIGGKEAGGDPEDELVVPGGVLAADAVDAGAELGGRVDPGNGVGVEAAGCGVSWPLQVLRRDEVDLQQLPIHGRRLEAPTHRDRKKLRRLRQWWRWCRRPPAVAERPRKGRRRKTAIRKFWR